MNKKLLFAVILALALIPIVAAQLTEGVENILGFVFDTTEEEIMYLKAIFWVGLFLAISVSAGRIFPENRLLTVILSLIISTAAVRLMPEDITEFLVGYSKLLLIVFIFLLPIVAGNLLGQYVFGWKRKGKTILIIIGYMIYAYILIKWQGIPIEGEAGNIFNIAFNWMAENTIAVLVVMAGICFFLLWWMGRDRVVESEGGKRRSFSHIFTLIFIFLIFFFLTYFFPNIGVSTLAIGGIIIVLYFLLKMITGRATLRGGLGRGARGAGELAGRGAGWLARKGVARAKDLFARKIQESEDKRKLAQAEQTLRERYTKQVIAKKGTAEYNLRKQKQEEAKKIRKKWNIPGAQ